MDTVPKEVVLSDPLVPLKWKLQDHQLKISADGVVFIVGVLRVISLTPNLCTPNTNTNTSSIYARRGRRVQHLTRFHTRLIPRRVLRDNSLPHQSQHQIPTVRYPCA